MGKGSPALVQAGCSGPGRAAPLPTAAWGAAKPPAPSSAHPRCRLCRTHGTPLFPGRALLGAVLSAGHWVTEEGGSSRVSPAPPSPSSLTGHPPAWPGAVSALCPGSHSTLRPGGSPSSEDPTGDELLAQSPLAPTWGEAEQEVSDGAGTSKGVKEGVGGASPEVGEAVSPGRAPGAPSTLLPGCLHHAGLWRAGTLVPGGVAVGDGWVESRDGDMEVGRLGRLSQGTRAPHPQPGDSTVPLGEWLFLSQAQ